MKGTFEAYSRAHAQTWKAGGSHTANWNDLNEKQQPIVKVEYVRPKTDKFRLQSVKLKTYRTGGEGRNTKEIHASRVKL